MPNRSAEIRARKMKSSEKSKLPNSRDQMSVSLASSLMPRNQLIDSLASHISLYNSHSPASFAKLNPAPRAAILKWFSSLTVQQRQAYLTVVDAKFLQLLMQMLGRMRKSGHGSFIILPDLPSGDLPGLCYRKSRGLVARVAESKGLEQLVLESVLFFGSREGESAKGSSSSSSYLDTLSVTEDFVANLDRFVEAMDKVSHGEFLRGDESDLGSDWVELNWLKSKGYYSIEAFIANRLDVSLRLAWLHCSSGKKRGVKLKEKLNGVGVAVNVYYRKKGCVDWWSNLGPAMRRKVWNTLLGKAAKSLIEEVLLSVPSFPSEEMWFFDIGKDPMRCQDVDNSGRTDFTFALEKGCSMSIDLDSVCKAPKSFRNTLFRLHVLQNITSLVFTGHNCEFSVESIFFSSFGSIGSVVDCILRKLRGFLMVISVDYTKNELLEVVSYKLPSQTSEEKLLSTTRKKKGKSCVTKRATLPTNPGLDRHSPSDRVAKECHCKLNSDRKSELVDLNKTNGKSNEDNYVTLLGVKKEISQGVVAGKGRKTGKKNKKEKKKKSLRLLAPCEINDAEGPKRGIAPSYATSKDKRWSSNGISGDLAIQNSNINMSPNASSKSIPNDRSTVYLLPSEASNAHNTLDEVLDGDSERKCCTDALSSKTTNCTLLVESVPARDEAVDSCKVEYRESLRPLGDPKSADKLNDEDHNFGKLGKAQLETPGKREAYVRPCHDKDESCEANPSTCPEFFSYEWPAVAPLYFPSVNPQLPTATDRLHLDVGHNMHPYVRQPFSPTVHHLSNPSVESGCTKVVPSPVPMSLDWPPVVRSGYGLVASLTCNYDNGVFSSRQAARDLGNECDGNWISEDEFGMHAVSGIDYNQYFGGGLMYWNPADHLGTGFSRPPSLSSDDSLWAWQEADLNRAVDDMVAFSSSYSTNGLTSPTAASFCSPFDPLGTSSQPCGYVISGNEVPGKVLQTSGSAADAACEEDGSGSLTNMPGDVDTNSADSLSYPILRPIIIPNISREISKSEFKRSYDLKSPHVPPSRREQPRIKRPPSPVVLCVPRAPRPPPPSPVSESRRHRGFPTVRSGSSSPRHWGMRGRYHDGLNWEEGCLRVDGAEVVWPWRNKKLSVHPIVQPLAGALLQDHLVAMSQLARDQDHPDLALPLEPPELSNCATRKESLSVIHNILNDEIEAFCEKVFAENLVRKPFINWAVKRVTRSLQVLWPRSRTNIFGSNATGLSLPSSDVDLVVCLPPVRNLEPIKEAGILEGRNGIKETCLQHAARYLANQEWVKSDSLKTVENTAIPIIMLVVEVPCAMISSTASNMLSPKEDPSCTTIDHGNHVHSDMVVSEDLLSPQCQPKDYETFSEVKSVRLDISFKTPSHTGLQTTELVKNLMDQFPAATPLALVLKQFLADRSLDQAYSGGLSSYCLILLITRFLQHEHHLGRPTDQNFGSLLMDFLYFFGNVFDPRQMRISVQGSGIYRNRERGYSIDPIHIDDPLCPTNNVGRNCFRIHQCIKAFSEAFSMISNAFACLPKCGDACLEVPVRLLPKIIPSISLY